MEAGDEEPVPARVNDAVEIDDRELLLSLEADYREDEGPDDDEEAMMRDMMEAGDEEPRPAPREALRAPPPPQPRVVVPTARVLTRTIVYKGALS